MAQNYASERYSTKILSLFIKAGDKIQTGPGPLPADLPPEHTLEQKIQLLVLAGNEAYIRGKYQKALENYLAACALFPVLIYPPLYTASLDGAEMLDLEIGDQLAAVSESIHRYRPLIKTAPIRLPDDPPAELLDLTERYTGTTGLAEDRTAAAAFFADAGQLEIAESLTDQATNLSNSPILQARIKALAGVTAMRIGDPQWARQIFSEAGDLLGEYGDRQAAAAMAHNLGVVATLNGEDDALVQFESAASRLPTSLAWSVSQGFESGSGVSRPVGAEALPFLIPDGDTNWSAVPSQHLSEAAETMQVRVGESSTLVNLTTGGRDLIEKVLEPRISEASLASLIVAIDRFPVFVSYLPHVRGFILPLALGDTYFALGDYGRASMSYIRARDYPYLNEAIERPMLWTRLARTYLTWGNQLYRHQNPVAARVIYEKIVTIRADGTFNLTGPLYEQAFKPLKDETLRFLASPDRLNFNEIDYSRRLTILETLGQVSQILQGVNYLGISENVVPIHDWRYLQNSARYFANQAIQAERAYVNFKSTAEKEELARVQLEQVVDAQQAATAVEQEKLKAARAQVGVAQLNRNLASERIRLGSDQYWEYARISEKAAYLERIAAKAQASDSWGGDFSGPELEFLGIPTTLRPGIHSGYSIPKLMTEVARVRSELTITSELNNMNRKLTELRAAEKVVDGEVAVAERMVDAAQAQIELAELRVQQARAQLDFFDSREFTPELWENLAQAQRGLSRRYLDSAIRAAFLMEQAFEFEYDTQVNRIRFDYERSELHGLLAGDYLLADVDQFSYDRLVETEKGAPAKVVVSLADRYPFQFYQGFQRTGRIDFETSLQDFDLWCPGSFQRKLRRVEVVIEGLVGPQGVCGTLTNSGVSFDRGRDGKRRTRLQKPETMILSRYDIRNDGIAFAIEEEQVLSIFENSGVATGWILDLPPSSNDLDYRTITNIHMVLYFDTYYSEGVRKAVRTELAATESYEHSIGFGLGDQFPDDFVTFQHNGEIVFDIREGFFPRHHVDPVLRDLYMVIDVHPKPAVSGLVTKIESVDADISASQATDADGMICTGAESEPLNVLRSTPLVGRWKLCIDEAANQELFEAGFSWDEVNNVFFSAEYTYTPRGRPAFELDPSNPLAAFEVIDDPKATTGAPSKWSFNSATATIQQTSLIHGPAAAGPFKPGTYLVRKPNTGWPMLSDFVLRCQLESANYDGGLGVVFRYRDRDNFYFFLMEETTYTGPFEGRGGIRIGKKVAGKFYDLDVAAFDPDYGYTDHEEQELVLTTVGETFMADLWGQRLLAGRDTSITQPGRVGLYCWNNAGASFLGLSLRSL